MKCYGKSRRVKLRPWVQEPLSDEHGKRLRHLGEAPYVSLRIESSNEPNSTSGRWTNSSGKRGKADDAVSANHINCVACLLSWSAMAGTRIEFFPNRVRNTRARDQTETPSHFPTGIA